MKKESKKIKKIYPGNFKSFDDFMDDCLKRAKIRMMEESGFGIPEPKQLNLFEDSEE